MSFQKSVLASLAKPIDVTSGGKLREDGHVFAETFLPESHKKKSIRTILGTTASLVRLVIEKRGIRNIPSDAWHVACAAYQHWSPPADTDFLIGANPKIKQIFSETISAMMDQKSGIANEASMVHLHQAQELQQEGKSVTVEVFPHTSLLDPFVMQAMLLRMSNGSHTAKDADLANEILGKQVVMVGQKVVLSLMQRMCPSFHMLTTIAPKYHAADREFSRAHSHVAGSIADGLRKHPDYWMTLFPEAGRTRGRQIGVNHRIPMLSGNTDFHVPVFIKTPPRLMDPDQGFKIADEFHAAMYVGKPFALATQRREKPEEYIRSVRQALADVGAPVSEYEWGLLIPDAISAVIPAPTKAQLVQSGWPETFKEVT